MRLSPASQVQSGLREEFYCGDAAAPLDQPYHPCVVCFPWERAGGRAGGALPHTRQSTEGYQASAAGYDQGGAAGAGGAQFGGQTLG